MKCGTIYIIIYERTIVVSFLIKDTTKEQREQIVKEGIALSTLDALPPTDEAMILFGKYINGEMELNDIIANMLLPYAIANV